MIILDGNSKLHLIILNSKRERILYLLNCPVLSISNDSTFMQDIKSYSVFITGLSAGTKNNNNNTNNVIELQAITDAQSNNSTIANDTRSLRN